MLIDSQIIENQDSAKTLVLAVGVSRFTASIVPDFKQQLREYELDELGRIVVDLSQVDFMDSNGLGAVVGITRMLNDNNKLRFVCAEGAVLQLLKLTRMDQAFGIFNNVEAAVA